ncbi:MAG: Clp protease N-terminal domain-containing protein [Actinomycetota bacterium]|nr:Clp protease N-terminal domain-containing protein [Actinomycetota bacterium]
MLAAEGVRLDELRTSALARTGSGAFPDQTSIPYTPQATLVFELAAGEADLLGHPRIGPEHILLGVMSEGSGIGSRVLSAAGAHLPRVRQRVAELHLA